MDAHIIVDPDVLAGKPVIKGTRIPVYLILNLIAHGKTVEQVMDDYPELTKEDIKAALTYAAMHMEHEEGKEFSCRVSKFICECSCFDEQSGTGEFFKPDFNLQ